MATVTEKVAYLKGLAEGMNIDETTKEGKLLAAVLDVLSDLAETLTDLEDYTAELTEQVDAIDEDLDLLESDYYDEWDEDEDEDGEFYEVTCQSCGTTFCVDEEVLMEGSIECPECGKTVEFDLDEEEEEGE